MQKAVVMEETVVLVAWTEGLGMKANILGSGLCQDSTAAVVDEQEHAKALSWSFQYSSIVNGDRLLLELMKCLATSWQ